nr:MAG TPA: hypothetical protein [Caudoviricetes sp.]
MNLHNHYWSRDFKSLVSTYFTIEAENDRGVIKPLSAACQLNYTLKYIPSSLLLLFEGAAPRTIC